MLRATEFQATATQPTPGYFYVDELGVFAHNMYAPLVEEIQAELVDPTYKRYRHGRCSTNNRGCSGPMCRKARRDWRSENARVKAQMKGRQYNPRPSAEKELTDWVFDGYDAHLDKTWVDRPTQYELERALKEFAQLHIVDSIADPLGNLQTPEYRPYSLLTPEFI